MVFDKGTSTVQACVIGVNVLQNEQMQFYLSLNFMIPEGKRIHLYSDRGNRNMYITDNLNNRYDHVRVGDAAGKEIIINTGDSALGWYLFPPAHPDAEFFIFHDDDNGVQTEPIARKGPKGMASFIFLFLVISMNNNPDTVPIADETKMVNSTPFQPTRAPIIARSLISPPPIPSFLVIRL